MKGPASQAMVPKLVPTRLLLNATALYSVTFNVAMFGGPMLSGLMIDTIGAGWSYVVNGALAVPAIVSVTMLRFSDAGQRGKVRLNVAYLFEGLTFAVQTRVLAAFIMLDTVAMVFGYYPALMPVFAGDILDSGGIGLGLLLGAAPVGALLGLLAILVLGDIHRKGLLILAVTIAHGAVLVAFAASSWFILSLLLVGVLGLLDSVSVSVRNTSFQLLATDANRGRVASLVGIAANASNSLGGAYLGLAASLMGPQRALAVGGIVGAAFSGLVAAGLPQVRRFRA
jgi:MFS family permease